MEKLQGIGVDVSKIAWNDTILTLAQKTFENQDEEELIEMIKGEDLNQRDKIGSKLSTMRKSYRQAKEGKKSEWIPPTEEQVNRMQKMGIRLEKLEKIDTIEEFIEKMEKLQGIGVDVSKIAKPNTILKLAQKTFVNQDEGELKEKIKGEGLEPEDKIGEKLSRVRIAYRKAKKGEEPGVTPPTEEQVNRMQEMGIRLEKLEKIDTIEEFIEKMEKLQGIGVDVSKITTTDTILTLAQKTFVNQDEEELKEKIKGEGLEPGDKIGSKLSDMRKSYKQAKEGKKLEIIPPTDEQVNRMQEMEIRVEEQDKIEEFIEKMEKLQGIGVDVSKITTTDTILTLAQKTFVNQDEEELKEKIKGEGLEPKDKIGNKLCNMRGTYSRAKKGEKTRKISPTEEQVNRIQEIGIRVEQLEKIDTIDEFIKKVEKLQGIGVDVSKIAKFDTILKLAQKTFVNQDEEELKEKIKGEGLEPGDKIGSKLNTMRTSYRQAKKGKKPKGTPPTEEQVKRMQEIGIILEIKKITGQDIGQASYTANVQECDDAQADLNRLVQEQQTKEGGQH